MLSSKTSPATDRLANTFTASAVNVHAHCRVRRRRRQPGGIGGVSQDRRVGRHGDHSTRGDAQPSQANGGVNVALLAGAFNDGDVPPPGGWAARPPFTCQLAAWAKTPTPPVQVYTAGAVRSSRASNRSSENNGRRGAGRSRRASNARKARQRVKHASPLS